MTLFRLCGKQWLQSNTLCLTCRHGSLMKSEQCHSENAHSHTSAFYSRSSRASGDSGRYRSHFPASGSLSGTAPDGIRASRPFSPRAWASWFPFPARSRNRRSQTSITLWKLRGNRSLAQRVSPTPKKTCRSSECFTSDFDRTAHFICVRSLFSPTGFTVLCTITSCDIDNTASHMVQFLDQEVQSTNLLAGSGSSHHMSNQRSWFTNFTAVHPGTWPVQAVGEHTTFVEGIGDIPTEINIRY